MSNLFLENIKIYQELKENRYKPPFYRVTDNIFLMMLCLCVIFCITSALTLGFVIAISIGVFWFFLVFLGIRLSEEKYWQTIFNPLKKAEYYINNHIYAGDISKLFDLNCVHTVKTLKEYTTKLEENIYQNRGLSGDLALRILNKIIQEKHRYNLEKQKVEENEIIRSQETKTGKMLNDIEAIKNM